MLDFIPTRARVFWNSELAYYWTDARQHGIYLLNSARLWSKQMAWQRLRDFPGYFYNTKLTVASEQVQNGNTEASL